MKDQPVWIQHFKGVNTRFSKIYTLLLHHEGISLAQYTVLAILLEENRIPMSEVSFKLQISKPSVTYLVDRLEAKKLLKRTAHPKDRRVMLIEIQLKGRRIVERTQGFILQFLMQTLRGFKEAEQKMIYRFFDSLSPKMDTILDEMRSKKK